MSRKEQIDTLVNRMQGQPNTAKERLEKLFDANSFAEIGTFNEDVGVVTGYGLINGKQVYAFSQQGAVGIRHANKIDNIYELAVKMGSPIIGIMDSRGLRLDEGIDALEAYGTIFKKQSSASGVIPQISIVFGECIGVASFMPIIADFVVMPETKAKMFMSSPSTIPGLDGKATTYDEVGGGKTLAEEGIVHCLCKDEEECLKKARMLVDFLPENNLEGIVPSQCNDDFNRTDQALNAIVPEDDISPIDIKYVINSIADNGEFLETYKEYAPNMITGFAKFAGITVGIIANNGDLRVDATKKAAEMVGTCDAFNIPLLTLTDVLGYERTLEAETRGVMKYSARYMSYFTSATVPKINLILRNAIGGSYLIMNSKHIGADLVYAWPSAKVSLMDESAAIEIMGASKEEYAAKTSPYAVEERGYIDAIIIPSNTRKRIISALFMLMSKREMSPTRKHSSIEY
ncbi:MAG: methylmalonyl-CoA carboxyltransferase [Firmicutes bacterium]|nr:methylmalonyl-CoA carboxyltransferase [Bacillota bacterium]